MTDKTQEDFKNSKVTERTNKILKIVAKMTKTIKSIPTGDKYNDQLKTNK